jgi:hypothetical protein
MARHIALARVRFNIPVINGMIDRTVCDENRGYRATE